jgi:heavy metal sensor kinase
MRSIRLSLILCFSLLLVLSLGAISGLVYRTTEHGLQKGQDRIEELLKANYEYRCKQEGDKLDADLLEKAKSLARAVEVEIQFPDVRALRLSVLAGPMAMPGIGSPIPLAFPLARMQLLKGSVSDQLFRLCITHHIKPEVMLPPEVGPLKHYYQINTMTGGEWRSLNMENANFDFNPRIFEDAKGDSLFDNARLQLDRQTVEVRRIRISFSNFKVLFPFANRGRNGGKSSTARESPAQPQPRPQWKWTIYIQVAADTAPFHAALAGFKRELDTELAVQQDKHQTDLGNLRNTLLLIDVGTLVAISLLGCLLITLGLAPLRRLSEAVSKVSEKDFRLPLENRKMPVELRPIVHRLDQTLDQLKRLFTREKQAAADISHELRTPLAAMLATLEVALRKPRSAEEYHEVLDECRIAGLQMSQLVERMLALARLDAGADHLRPREVDVGKLADQCANLVRPLAEARGLNLVVKHEGNTNLKADPDKVREIVTNLLHNAIEYNRPEGNIEVNVGRDNGYLSVAVTDTGIGIPEESRELIFERFFRQDPSRTGEGLHAGIGLALVKGYVELMGGRIEVDSVLGEGSTFRIQLPVQEPAAVG